MNSNDLPTALDHAKSSGKVVIYLLEAWYDGATATAYDSGRTIEVDKVQADTLVFLGTAQYVEES